MNHTKTNIRWRFLSQATLGALVLCAFANTAGAESYTHWLRKGKDKSGSLLEITPLPGLDAPESTAPSAYSSWNYPVKLPSAVRIVTAPVGGVIGTLPLKDLGSHQLPATLSFYATAVELRDLATFRDPTHTNIWSDDAEWLNRNAPIREIHYTEIIRLKTSPTEPILVKLPTSPQPSYRYPTLFSLRIELKDSLGQILARSLPVPVYNPRDVSGAQALVAPDGNLERFFRDNLRISQIRTLRTLPSTVDAFLDVPLVGISSSLLQNADLNARELRRALLAGTRFFGPSDAIANLKVLTGIDKTESIALGKLYSIPEVTLGSSGAAANNTQYYSPLTFGESSGSWRELGDDSYHGLFEPYRARYLHWTVLLLTGFSIVLMVGIPFGFFFLAAQHRLHLWWGVPLLALSIAVAAYGVGTVSLPREPLVHITEHRFAFSPWNEVFHQVNLQTLRFQEESLTFYTPTPLEVSRNQNYSYEQLTPPRVTIERDGARSEIQIKSTNRGTPETANFNYFSEEPLPAVAQVTPAKFQLRATAAIRKAYVATSVEVYDCGRIRAGETRTQSECSAPANVKGFLGPLSTYLELPPFYSSSVSQSSYFTLGRAGLENDVILIASTDEQPSLKPIRELRHLAGEVIWTIHFPENSESKES